jgi:glycosyltransferase involved in cell wall biosynthesis
MLKIAVIASSYPRFEGDGVAPFVKSISESLIHHGHHVEVVAPYDPAVKQSSDHSITVHRFKYTWPEKFHILGHAKSLQADVKLRPLAIFLLPLFLISALITLFRTCKKMHADIIHAHWVLPNGLPAAIISKLLNIPLIISLHGSDIFVADKNFLFKSVAKWVLSQSSSVTACSQELKDRALKINPDIDITLLPWGADPKAFQPLEKTRKNDIRKSYGWKTDEIIIIALGRFVYKKGFENLIAITSDLPLSQHKIRVVIGGSGDLITQYQQQVNQNQIADIVDFPGQITWDAVPEFLGSADIFTLPSQRDKAGNLDGLPTVLLEAMACGLPVVASDIGGVKLVVNEENGFLVEPGQRKQLLDALTKLIKDPTLRTKMGINSRQKICQQYHWESVGKEIEFLMLKAIKQRTKKN